MLLYAIIGCAVGGAVTSILGLILARLRLATLTFVTAHAALAGASIAMVLDLDVYTMALMFSLVVSLVLGSILSRIERYCEHIAMTFFSVCNAIALLAIYYCNKYVLATTVLSSILWGSVLAITTDKMILLIAIGVMLCIYLTAFSKQLNAIMFDRRLAEAEGINIEMHTTILIALLSLCIAVMLRIVGGFLIFSLTYIAPVTAMYIAFSSHRQLIAAGIIGGSAPCLGLGISYWFDLPVGVSITLTTAAIAAIAILARKILEKRLEMMSVDATEK